MYRYRKIMAVLNCRNSERLVTHQVSDGDRNVIQFAGLVSRMAKSETVYFFHVAPHLGIPKELHEKYFDLIPSIEDMIDKKIEQMVSAHFEGYSETQSLRQVAQGSTLDEIIKAVCHHEMDLVIVGTDPDDKKSLVLADKLARKAPCSVLVVPEKKRPVLNRILVPVDFSEHSEDAMDVGVAFALATGLKYLIGLHVYGVFIPGYNWGEKYQDLVNEFRTWAERHYQTFMGKIDTKGIEVKPILTLDPDTPAAIERTAKEQHIDLIILGTRGKGSLAALLGSVTEQLIWSTEFPLLAVKKKGAGLGLLDVLFKP